MKDEEAPLIGTLRFVFVMGATFLVLWFAMYVLAAGALVRCRFTDTNAGG